jgi:hypothetical protein
MSHMNTPGDLPKFCPAPREESTEQPTLTKLFQPARPPVRRAAQSIEYAGELRRNSTFRRAADRARPDARLPGPPGRAQLRLSTCIKAVGLIVVS